MLGFWVGILVETFLSAIKLQDVMILKTIIVIALMGVGKEVFIISKLVNKNEWIQKSKKWIDPKRIKEVYFSEYNFSFSNLFYQMDFYLNPSNRIS